MEQTRQKYTADSYLQHIDELLHLEYKCEKEAFAEQTQRRGIYDKVRKGLCWYPVTTGRSYYNSLNQYVVEIERTEDKDIEHSFEYGKPVCFFTADETGNIDYMHFSCTVNYVDGDRMVVILPSESCMAQLGGYTRLGIQLYFDETSYRLMFEAMSKVIASRDNRLAEFKEIFHGKQKCSTYSFRPMAFPWLNKSQENAVNNVLLAKDVAIVHGPPGTGKTTTLVEAIYETLHRESQVLVCAQSNMAVDWISEKLVERGVPVLRIGNPTRVNDKMLSFTFEKRFENHPDYPLLWQVRRSIRELYSRIKGSSDREKIRTKINSLRDRATELEIRITEAIFNEARVISSTLTGAASKVLVGHKFGTLFIDEAAQALEAACWIAIAKADKVVLAGDHCQLPPTIKSVEAMREGLDRTLMQEIADNRPECVTMLNIQYRMNDEIMNFPSQWFYHSQLKSAPEVKYRGILDFDTAIEWIDTHDDEYGEESVFDNIGKINKKEAVHSLEILKAYIGKITRERILDENIDFGIISPYKAQVYYLRRLLRQDAFFKPYRKLITVNTVDGFQGQERDVILISLVRSNEDGNIGFLRDLRRMNVAITRARMKLIITGDASTLTKHPFYKKLYEYIETISV